MNLHKIIAKTIVDELNLNSAYMVKSNKHRSFIRQYGTTREDAIIENDKVYIGIRYRRIEFDPCDPDFDPIRIEFDPCDPDFDPIRIEFDPCDPDFDPIIFSSKIANKIDNLPPLP